MSRGAQASFSRNRLLSTMEPDDFARLRPALDRVPLGLQQTIEEPGRPFEHVYFPEPSVLSLVAETKGGEKMEVGLFGPEGVSGLAAVHGEDRSPFRTFVQVPGQALRMPAEPFRAALAESATLRRLMSRYAQAQAVQVAFAALVNGRHTLEERLARWLLMCHDRIDGDVIPITHDALSLMLGVRRAGVTTALHLLEGERIVKATRGAIQILDRAELQATAGDSYGPPEAEYERLFGG